MSPFWTAWEIGTTEKPSLRASWALWEERLRTPITTLMPLSLRQWGLSASLGAVAEESEGFIFQKGEVHRGGA